MDDARRDQIQTILGQISTLSLDQRAQFLGEVCGGDAQFRALVEDRLNLIDAIAVDAVTNLPNLNTGDEGHDSPSQPKPLGLDQAIAIDFVDGLPIDEYCDNRGLNVPARLRLFVQACETVQFAHQHAIIHRNLRPSNILVAPDETLKLTGLGPAELMQPEPGGRNTKSRMSPTVTGAVERVLSPEYASPEQIEGEAVTTASDVYALGLVLYRLLCGRWPYRLKNQDSAEILQAICEQVPEKPSVAVGRSLPCQPGSSRDSIALLGPLPPSETSSESTPFTALAAITSADEIAAIRGTTPARLKRMLAGDLDAITLMAIRKEPQWRYSSVEQLRNDLHCYLKGLPVQAHADSLRYRVTKFIQRHAAAVVIGLACLGTLIATVINTTSGLMIARQQRDRAERSSSQALQTIDQFFHRINEDRLLKEQGLLPLRRRLLDDTQHFYEEFLKERSADSALRAEVAMARTRVAEITGRTGLITRAIVPYQQAVALWEKLVAEEPKNQHYQVILVETLSNFGEVLLTVEGRTDEARRAFCQARELVETLIATHPKAVSLQTQLAMILLNIAEIDSRQGKPDEAITLLERVQGIDAQLITEDPDSVERRISLATAHARLGHLFGTQPGQWLEAITAYDQAIELRAAITRQHPELVDQSYQLASELKNVSDLQQRISQPMLALENLHRALQIFERITQTYPGVARYQEGLGATYNLLSDLERQRGERGGALTFAQKGIALFEQLVAENPKDDSYRRNLINSHNNLGRLRAQAGETKDALLSFQRSVDLIESLTWLTPQDRYNLASNMSRCIPLIGVTNQRQDTPRVLSKSDQIRRKLYGDRAIDALQRSSVGGGISAEILQNDSDLDPLRGRADFQAFVKEVEERPSTRGK
jgi:serine/threonine protein kinase